MNTIISKRTATALRKASLSSLRGRRPKQSSVLFGPDCFAASHLAMTKQVETRGLRVKPAMTEKLTPSLGRRPKQYSVLFSNCKSRSGDAITKQVETQCIASLHRTTMKKEAGAKVSFCVIANEVKQSRLLSALDCFAASRLAMTKQVETRLIASLQSQPRHPAPDAGSPDTARVGIAGQARNDGKTHTVIARPPAEAIKCLVWSGLLRRFATRNDGKVSEQYA